MYTASNPYYCCNCEYWDGKRTGSGNSSCATVPDRTRGMCTNGRSRHSGEMCDPLTDHVCKVNGTFVRWHALKPHPFDNN